MVKVVTGDEIQLNLVENRLGQSDLTSQVGLVIGKFNSTLERGFVYDLVPTPLNDAGEPACSLIDTSKPDKKKGSSKSKALASDSSTLIINNDWVSDHARQVSRMLLGGMKVIGIYVWVSDTSFENSTITLYQLMQTVNGVAEASPVLESDWDERLLIHICHSPRRWTCRNCLLSSNITSTCIRPCEFKMGRVLSSLQSFRCTYNFELSLPVCREDASNASRLSEILRHGISVHAKELRGAKALIDGKLVVDDNDEKPCISDGLHEVELLLPFMENTLGEVYKACNQNDVVGVLIFSGSVCSFAYINSKEPLTQAVADTKDDIIKSLQSRLDVICDDEDLDPRNDDNKEASEELTPEKSVSRLVLQLLRKTCNLTFPRRVFIPWLGGTFICDYLQPSDSLEVIKAHCVELMSMETPTDSSAILQPELTPPSLVAKSFWHVTIPGQSVSSSSLEQTKDTTGVVGGRNSTKFLDFRIFTALLVALLSVLVGFAMVRQA